MVGRCMELGPPGQSPSLLPSAPQGLAVASPDGMRAAQDSVSGVRGNGGSADDAQVSLAEVGPTPGCFLCCRPRLPVCQGLERRSLQGSPRPGTAGECGHWGGVVSMAQLHGNFDKICFVVYTSLGSAPSFPNRDIRVHGLRSPSLSPLPHRPR
ncbi:hypothetical protein J1605_006455 [Eschrichtius robustus]|uniref:Uncharacterized protein n=1 Tax=Eschrichtius robustus TaxID=9764 RepID=A0AB34H5Q8_ESCRO|nr:hypothetical protein J1605_006455 [Eschrichtius robustus]